MKNRIIIGAIFYLLGMSCTKSPDDIPTTGSAVSVEAAQEALDFHNKIRADVEVPALEWSNELATYAQEWADYLAFEYQCTMEHRGTLNMNIKGYGENLFWGKGMDYSPTYASQAWYSEIEIYIYTEITADNFHETGHYTQMVWKNTKELGMGIAICPDGATIIVANYNPPGNYLGQKPY